MKQLDLDLVEDSQIREIFKQTQAGLDQVLLDASRWVMLEINVDQARANYRFKHGLRFAPKDVIQTSLQGAGTLTWNYALFDQEFLDITTTGPCKVRAFIGTYPGERVV